MRGFSSIARAALLAANLCCCAAAAAAPAPAPLEQMPAPLHAYASSEMILAATHAGQRLVAVGDHGVVLLSDDGGKSYRQARAVPTSATLTGVSFSDARNGWAVGHLGVILHTSDGGETWVLQRSDTSTDQPLFAVYFSDAEHGVAAGLWSLLLITADGGQVWKPVALKPPPGDKHADRNLFAIFANHKGSLFMAAERGAVLRSDDQGASWWYLNTGASGSFWTGCALPDGTLVVAGLRGHVYRSTDDGQTWNAVPSGTKNSITDIIEDGTQIVGVGLDGTILRSQDGGKSFQATQRNDRVALTAVLASPAGELRLFSDQGVVDAN